jgi:hypothetical protein
VSPVRDQKISKRFQYGKSCSSFLRQHSRWTNIPLRQNMAGSVRSCCVTTRSYTDGLPVVYIANVMSLHQCIGYYLRHHSRFGTFLIHPLCLSSLPTFFFGSKGLSTVMVKYLYLMAVAELTLPTYVQPIHPNSGLIFCLAEPASCFRGNTSYSLL